jgi:hypothetical protein
MHDRRRRHAELIDAIVMPLGVDGRSASRVAQKAATATLADRARTALVDASHTAGSASR